MRRVVLVIMALLMALPLSAQADKREVRRGNRKFDKKNYKEAELDYRRALVKDSTSFAGVYDLASVLYKQKDFEGAASVISKTADAAAESAYADRYYYNSGDISLQKKDYAAAVEAFKQSLLRNPGDLEAKENYIYAKKMLENQQNQDQQNQDNKDQNKQDQDDQQQNQQPKDQPEQQQEQPDQPQEQKISPQQAQQMLQAIQAKEKETQDKVEKAKALQAKTRQKEKNW
ncbi:MAG: tetratricopeptide repeat protein [Bacteroidales bacterium]|nr:tetratricopeptide repeat protein [Bacteroidales bacterium]